MHSVNAGYTVIARLKEDTADTVSALLAEMSDHRERLPFEACATTHFATCTVLPAQMYGDEELPACLMIATSFSGPARVHEEDLVRVVGAGLRELLQHCEMFPDACSDAELVRYLREHRQSDTFYSGMQDLTRADVVRHDELRTAIGQFVDTTPIAGDARAARAEIQRFVRSRPDLAWAEESWTPDPSSVVARSWRSLVVLGVALAFAAWLVVGSVAALLVASKPLHMAAAGAWLILILAVFTLFALIQGVRIAEDKQTFVAGRQPDAHARALDATQCHPVINEMTIVGPIKEGRVRPITLRLALWIVARVAEGIPYVATFEKGISIPTVATARWIAADRGKRLIFISNYTNASEPYVRDFIDLRFGAMRINLTFGFGRGYPKTAWIIFGGALDDPNGYINAVHANQKRTEYWFCPYKNLSIDNIQRNRALREGLFGDKTDDETRAWLELV